MKKKYFLVIFLLAVLVFWGYFEVVQNPQLYYDDLQNIFNTTVASKNFNWQTIKNVLLFSFGGFRPVSYLTFYLNYLFWGSGTENLLPYILTNVIIHFFNALLVFLVSLKLTGKDFKVAFLVSIAWALSPANSLAVDYLVQRMTSLMFFFGMLSFYFFITYMGEKKVSLFVTSVFFLLLSILSKQNGVLFIPLFFVYLVWFDYIKVDIKKLYILFVLLFVLFSIAAGEYFLPKAIIRGFSPYQRLLTESRVVVYYLKVLLIPFPSEVFLYIDFPLSKSVFHPISTLFSSLFLISLFWLSFFLFNKNRLASFGIIGFFLFHSVEASTIPLYTAFLHRNYLPSFFLYLALFKLVFDCFKKDFLSYIIALILIANFAFVLKVHNTSYISPFYYLSQNYKSFPSNKDLCAAYGMRYAKIGNYKKAIELYLKSFRADKVENRLELVLGAFYNMGCFDCVIKLRSMIKGPVIYQIVGKAYKKIGNYNQAETYLKSSLEIQFSRNTLFAYLDLLAKEGRFKEILDLIHKYNLEKENNELIVMYQINSYIELGMLNKAEPLFGKLKSKNVYYWLKGKYLLKKGEINKAIETLNKIEIKVFTPANIFIGLQKTLLLSDAYIEKKDYKKAIKVLENFSGKDFFNNVIEMQLKKIKGIHNVD